MKIKITRPGLYDGQGVEIPVGRTFSLKEAPEGWAGRYDVISDDDGKAPATGKETAAERKAREKAEKEAAEAAQRAFRTEQRDDQFVILNAEGDVQGAPLTEADAKTFDELPADQQAEFVAGHIAG